MSDQATRRPLAAERRTRILAAVERDGVVRISQLIDELGAAPVTLRRDLAQLEDEGLLVRVHGGAVLPDGTAAPESAEADATGQAEQQGTDTVPGGSIAVLVPSLNYYWPAVIRGIEPQALRRGFRVVLRGATYDLQDERPILQRLLDDEQVRGLLVAPNTDTAHAQEVIQWLAGSGVPSVLMERDAELLPAREPAESVASDHAHGAALAARHLAELGHRRVGLVLSRFSPTSRKIAAGWRVACAGLGLAQADGFEPLLPDRSSADFTAAVNATLDAALDAGLTALLIHSDPEAMAVIDLALNRGIRVPHDLSVIAYDDEIAKLFRPALTAVSPPRSAVGEVAVDQLADRIADPGRPNRRVLLSPHLHVRESTAPPRPAE
jgi:DNA-binding LacI/PurR family transcriptional regulator